MKIEEFPRVIPITRSPVTPKTSERFIKKATDPEEPEKTVVLKKISFIEHVQNQLKPENSQISK